MSKPELYPLTFEPILKDYIWGGRNLERHLGRSLPPGITAESWEIAGHPDGITAVLEGPLAGQPLTAVLSNYGLDLIGENNRWALEQGKFPLLIKLLDAHAPLSVQVHPNDDYALTHEGNELGKTEMWVVLHAEDDAAIVLGVSRATTPESFRVAVESGKLEPLLHRLAVKAGDVICVPAGSLHAILAGCLIAEIQQNSNATYRVYDWNRLGHDGRPRPLHVEKSLDVIDFSQVRPGVNHPQHISDHNGTLRERLCANRYFVTERWRMKAGSRFRGQCDGSSLEIWGVLAGATMISGHSLSAVRFILLPANLGQFTVTAIEDCLLLRTFVPSSTS